MRERFGRLREAWIDRIWLDLVLAALLVGAYAAGVYVLGWYSLLDEASAAARRTAFTATAVIVSLLTSFSAAALGQMNAAKGDRASALKRQAGEMLARNWRSIFRAGLLSAVVAVVAVLIDGAQAAPAWAEASMRWLYLAVVVLALVRFLRLSALFSEVTSITSLDDRDGTPAPRARLEPTPDWHRRQVG